MWYSFLGTVLTVLFGLLISMISDCIATTKISGIVDQQPDCEKPASPAVQSTIDPFHKQLKGYDNAAMVA